jgi:hypothetical protein
MSLAKLELRNDDGIAVYIAITPGNIASPDVDIRL